MSSDIPVHKQSRVDGDNCVQTMLNHSSASLFCICTSAFAYLNHVVTNAVCDCLSGTDQINRSSGAHGEKCRNIITLQQQMLNSLSL